MVFAGAQRIAARRFAGWTLRARLLAAMLALLAMICVIICLVTQFLAHKYLVNQIDSRLTNLSSHAVRNDPPPDPKRKTPQYITQMGMASVFMFGDDQTYGNYMAENGYGGITPTDAAQNRAISHVPKDGEAHTINVPGLGNYRVVAASYPVQQYGGSSFAVAIPLDTVDNAMAQLRLTEICVTIAGLIAVGLVGETIIRRTLRPLNRVASIATRVSEMELDRGEVALKMRVPARDTDPRTEIGQVGGALNGMLNHVSNALAARQASEVRVRKFVADASHELRTPLAAIRGYAELTRRVDDGSVSEDVAYAMRRVESESARMTTLVEDLLLLARIDAGRPLDRSPVDLSMLVVDVVSDAHVAGNDHNWNLELPDEAVTIVGDGPRLHQIFANLLTNARVHTPAGTKVTLALAPNADGGATITVVDDGPGIPPALLPDVFERFARGDSSRSRAAGSTGLGLAILAAVVDAHGGSVTVSSAPGETAFVVVLPPEPPPEYDGDDERPAQSEFSRRLDVPVLEPNNEPGEAVSSTA